jgi:hypothetical protein
VFVASTRPGLLASGPSIAAQGRSLDIDAAIGAAGFFASAVLAVALMFLL